MIYETDNWANFEKERYQRPLNMAFADYINEEEDLEKRLDKLTKSVGVLIESLSSSLSTYSVEDIFDRSIQIIEL